VSDDKNNDTGSDNAAGSPLRPSGKRQVSGAGNGSAGAAAERSEISVSGADSAGSGKKGGSRVLAYPRSVGSELKKVIWPTGREMVTYTVVTLVFLILITGLCTGVDLLAGEGIKFMFGL
jgi:preprotein translocase subunit SecE